MSLSFLKPAYPDSARLTAQLPSIRRVMGDRKFSGRVLNAGCGEGLYCGLLESFSGVTRIDDVDLEVSPDFRTWHPDPRHHPANGSLTSLPFDDATFDGILCTEVLEHIPDDRLAARELARVSRPGALIVASVPRIPAPPDPHHAREGYSVESFTALLNDAGFDVHGHATCCHGPLKLVMIYWRRPWMTFGPSKTPYIPAVAMQTIAHLDTLLKIGSAWDLVVVGSKR